MNISVLYIEIYNESKHGNIFKAKGKDWDMGYSTLNHEPIPIEAPVCISHSHITDVYIKEP